jgi:hypothetical protein
MTTILKGLAAEGRRAVSVLADAFQRARTGSSITQQDRQIIRACEAGYLNAANPYARTALGNALWGEFAHHLGIVESSSFPNVPLFWLTLADVGCMTALNATSIDVAGFVRHLRSGLQGLSYIGILEPALYVNIQPGTNYPDKTGTCWHLHLVAWGASRNEMKALFKKLNTSQENYRPIIHRNYGGVGADWRPMTEENLVRRFRYMLKMPRKAYRVGRKKIISPDGQVDFKFTHNKALLQPGHHVTVFHQLKRLCLDELLIAGEEGVGIRRRALRSVALTLGQHHR